MKSVDLSGLDNFNVSDLMSEKPLENAGKALMIPGTSLRTQSI